MTNPQPDFGFKDTKVKILIGHGAGASNKQQGRGMKELQGLEVRIGELLAVPADLFGSITMQV